MNKVNSDQVENKVNSDQVENKVNSDQVENKVNSDQVENKVNSDQVENKVNSDQAKIVTTVADEIWNDIQNKTLELFSLPGQTVVLHCTPIKIEPNKCYLLTKIPAVLPALEDALKIKYLVDRRDKFIVVERKQED